MTIRASVLGLAIATIGLATTGLAVTATSAQAFQIVNRSGLTDTQFNDLIKTGQFTEKFVAESRIGNKATNGTHEVGILDASRGLLPDKTAQKAWVSGQEVAFELKYDGSTVEYIVGGQKLSSTKFTGPITDFFLRTRAAQGDSQTNGSQLPLKNLKLTNNGHTRNLDPLMSEGSKTQSDVDYMQVSNLRGAFTLTGTSVMNWTFTRTQNSQLAYQIKVGTTPPKEIPEPMALGALAIAGIAIYRSKRQLSIRSTGSSTES